MIIISLSYSVNEKYFRQKLREETRTLYSMTPFVFESRTIYDILWKDNTDGEASESNIIWLLHIACWIRKATNTNSEYAQYVYCNNGCTNAPQYFYSTWPVLCYICTNILTPWCNILLEKLTGLQLVKKSPAFHGTRRFITALTSVRLYIHINIYIYRIF